MSFKVRFFDQNDNREFMFRLVFILLFLIFNSDVIGQTMRFSLQMGAAIPVGEFAKSDYHPDNGGFAQTGIDMHFVGENVREDNWLIGVNIGYSIFSLDKEAVKKLVYPNDPSLVQLETQSHQHVNLQFRLGYNFDLNDDQIEIVPFVDAGAGLFNSAYYLLQIPNRDRYARTGDTGLSFLISPGVDVLIKVNSFVSMKAYGTYQFANYSLTDEFVLVNSSGNNTKLKSTDVEYGYRNVALGLGAVFVF